MMIFARIWCRGEATPATSEANAFSGFLKRKVVLHGILGPAWGLSAEPGAWGGGTKAHDLGAHVSRGEEWTVIGVLGGIYPELAEELEAFPGVEMDLDRDDFRESKTCRDH